jgi:ribosomal protein S18 acetylase RimI-like enzyme
MNTEISIRLANIYDLENICMLFEKAIRSMNENKIPQWDELYPNQEIISEDIGNTQMYLGEIENQIVCAFVINQQYDEQYKDGDWKYQGSSFSVIHRLCVNPQFQRQGIGTKTMQIIEDMLKNSGIKAIKLDAFSQNPHALRMYEKLGYLKIGEANWRKGLFYLYEKLIDYSCCDT